jgi:hypothetical protein
VNATGISSRWRVVDPGLQRGARHAAPEDVVVEHVGAAQRQRLRFDVPRGRIGGVKDAYQRARRRADDEIGMHASLLQHFQHADVREAARSTRREHQRQRGRPRNRRRIGHRRIHGDRLLGGIAAGRHPHDQQHRGATQLAG